MSRARFSIGIDLGTTNCAMAYASLDGEVSGSEMFSIPQWETSSVLSESLTLPSFLYLPKEIEAAQMLGKTFVGREWIAGRFARKQASESPGRVAHSAKSWLCHHAVDRDAPFLPWRSDEIAVEKRISPIQASALLLEYLRGAWDARFAHDGAAFLEQEITITVPASFDAVAQRLTLEAASLAGFSANVRLLEEPQAAFYRWLEEHVSPEALRLPETGSAHVLVIDIGGGTSDFSLFEISRKPESALPHIKRIAVSDHLLLGGDNIDLALAHHVEPRLASQSLSASQWNFLVARCRDLKERCLAGAVGGEDFVVSVPSQGSSLLAGTLTARIQRKEIESIVLDGFFPECSLDDLPIRTQAGLREWALPYAADSAVTRYLADFLRGRPRVDAILFNGGSLHPEALRKRLQRQIASWQPGTEPQVLENSEPDLAVARGAARFGSLVYRRAERIEAGAARAIYLEVHRQTKDDEHAALVCILPKNAAAEDEFQISQPGLELRLNHPVRFQPYYSTRHDADKPGSLVPLNDRDFHRLPPLQTIAKLAHRQTQGAGDRLPVMLTAKMNELGLLQVACLSTDPRVKQSWPLEFNLRPQESGEQDMLGTAARRDPGVDDAQLDAARARISSLFSRPLDKRDKLSATNLLKNLEQILGTPKADWNWVLVRELWATHYDQIEHRKKSIEHEEAWLILAGFLLRPGFGAEGDGVRIDQLWQIQTGGLAYPGKRIQLQQYILWRRIAGGLSRERQQTILRPELPKLLDNQKGPAPELIRLSGSLERIDHDTKSALTSHFLEHARDFAERKQYCAPYLASLGLLLNRTPLYAGIEDVMAPEHVERAFLTLCDLDWTEPELAEIQALFLRAARVIDDPRLDLPRSLREKIASKLEKSGVTPSRVEKIRRFVPVERAERAGLLGESLPPGLVLDVQAP